MKNSPKQLDKNRILVVDDDPGTLGVVNAMLTSSGYDVYSAKSAAEALHLLQDKGFDFFEVVLTDYYMPNMTGLELLTLIFDRDPNLSSILMTAEGDIDLVTGALKHGAIDYIEKPFRLADILSALEKALITTVERRYLAGAAKEIREINLIQEVLVSGDISQSSSNLKLPKIRTAFHPLKETGGDFINCLNLGEGRMCLAGADVSGHDLKAGFISAYFQGIARGMLEMRAGLQTVRDYFNEFLLREWNPRLEKQANSDNMTSLAVCMLLFDLYAEKIHLINNGFPLPLLIDGEGRMLYMGEGNEPLGWFADLSNKEMEYIFPKNGSCMLWSDGLEDQAMLLGVKSSAFASRLIDSGLSDKAFLLDKRKDDILLIEMVWGDTFHRLPIYLMDYPGDLGDEIDEAQADWELNLRFVIPHISKDKVNEIMICIREALLNAVIHGCECEVNRFSRLQIACSRDLCEVFVRIDDEGQGYNTANDLPEFDPLGHTSLGLRVIECYAHEMKVLNNGSTISMSFKLS